MGLSVIVIGRNSERTLPECISSICIFAQKYSEIDIELLYVDSASSDSSIDIVKNELKGTFFSWKIVIIESSKQSAALGRRIGMEIAFHSDLLFVDSDMVIDHAWLKMALTRRDYRILSGQRFEVYLDSNTCWVADRSFYKATDLGRVSRPGGLFLLFDANRTSARFTSFLRSEEEADFVAQDELLHESIYRTPEVAFIHLNRKPTALLNRLYENLRSMPAMSSYISGRIHAIRYGFYSRLLRSSHFYETGAICSLLFYVGFALSNWIIIVSAVGLVAASKRKMSIIYRSIVFPIELMFGLFHYFTQKKNYKIEYSILASSLKLSDPAK